MPNTKEISKIISDFYKEDERDKAKRERALARKLKRKVVRLEAKANIKNKSKHGYNRNSDGRQRSIGNNSKVNTKNSGTHQGKERTNNKKGGVKSPLK